MQSGYLTYKETIKLVNTSLTEILKNSNLFNSVIRGYPEDVKIFKGIVATTAVMGIGFENFMGEQNIPNTLKTFLGVVVRGTKTTAHDKTLEISLDVLDKFQNDATWKTLDGTVRNTLITNFNMFPERNKKMNLFFTTGLFELEHHILRHRKEVVIEEEEGSIE